jgi:hypothetical protein
MGKPVDFQRGEWHEAATGLLRGGSRLLACGEIAIADEAELRQAFESRGLVVAFYHVRSGYLRWEASRYPWAITAGEFVQAQLAAGSTRHVLNGLLYGYGPAEIDEYLRRDAAAAGRPDASDDKVTR